MATALVLGATGETGRHALLSALALDGYTRVIEAGRRSATEIEPTSSFSLSPSTPGFSKLSFVAVDFEKLANGDAGEQAKLKVGADAVLVCMGTTLGNAGSMAKFVRIDHDYVVAAAQAAKEGNEQALVYCSSGAANSGSWFPYLRSKGRTEEELAGLGYARTVVMRLGLLRVPGGRTETRRPEYLASLVTGVMARFTDNIEIPTPLAGRGIALAGLDKTAFTLGSKPFGGLGAFEQLKGSTAWGMNNAQALAFAKLQG